MRDNTVITLGHDDCRVELWTLGAAVNGLWTRDRTGNLGCVCPGYATPADRLKAKGYFGEIVGPFGNRIAGGRFTLDGQAHDLDVNEPPNTLHSGPNGLHRQVWDILEQDSDHAVLAVDFPSGQGGFPGPIHVQVRYWVAGTVVGHEITATTERPTVANIVSHVYFNLSGRLQPMNKPDPASRHELTVAAARHLPVTRQLIPLPEAPAPVSGELDLRSARPLDEVVAGAHPQIQLLHGVDHAFVLDQPVRTPAATLSHPCSGRTVSIETDYPAIQIYTGQAIEDPCLARPEGQAAPFVAVAIETEGYPDAPNRPDFPGTTLRPGETYRHTTTWRFSVV